MPTSGADEGIAIRTTSCPHHSRRNNITFLKDGTPEDLWERYHREVMANEILTFMQTIAIVIAGHS
jgi:hypothetical protein